MILRARAALPVTGPVIEDAALRIAGDRIIECGRWGDVDRPLDDDVVDLGDQVLLPALVNVHCHLDYTRLAPHLPVTRQFTEWIQALAGLKVQWDLEAYRESWRAGAAMLVQSGVGAVADVEAIYELLPEMHRATPLCVYSFLEMTGVKSRTSPAKILEDAAARLEPLGEHAGLSPHALYSTTPELLRLTAAFVRQTGRRLVLHLAESLDEYELYRYRSGPLYAWLHAQRDMSDCGGITPVECAEASGLLGERLLAVHCNYLGPDDAARLGNARVNVLHCPRSHAYFGFQPFPWQSLRAAGVSVSLGTDSLASGRELGERPESRLDLFAEMRAFRRAFPGVPPEEILPMVTSTPARALGLGQTGGLHPGMRADVIGVPFAGKPADALEAATTHAGPVSFSVLAGKWIIGPGTG